MNAAYVPGPVAAAGDEAVYVSKTLSKFLSAVDALPAAVLVDLGPVIGSNISFLGERFCCKIHVGDVYADLDRHTREGTFDRLLEFLARRFSFSDGSVDAVLCWDIFDYLGSAAGGVLAAELMRLLRPGWDSHDLQQPRLGGVIVFPPSGPRPSVLISSVPS